MPSKEEIIWTAGLLEGEGSFQVRNNHSGIMISCSMIDEDVIKRLKEIWEGNIHYRENKNKENWKPAYRWYLTKQDKALQLCKKILPHMAKRRSSQIEKCIEERKRIEKAKKQKRQRIKSRNEKIRKDYNDGDYTYRSLGEKYDLSRTTIYRILDHNDSAYN